MIKNETIMKKYIQQNQDKIEKILLRMYKYKLISTDTLYKNIIIFDEELTDKEIAKELGCKPCRVAQKREKGCMRINNDDFLKMWIKEYKAILLDEICKYKYKNIYSLVYSLLKTYSLDGCYLDSSEDSIRKTWVKVMKQCYKSDETNFKPKKRNEQLVQIISYTKDSSEIKLNLNITRNKKIYDKKAIQEDALKKNMKKNIAFSGKYDILSIYDEIKNLYRRDYYIYIQNKTENNWISAVLEIEKICNENINMKLIK